MTKKLKLTWTTILLTVVMCLSFLLYYGVLRAIPQSVAITIMNVPVVVCCIGNSKYQMIASILTGYRSSAEYITGIVGFSPRTPIGCPENHGTAKDVFMALSLFIDYCSKYKQGIGFGFATCILLFGIRS